MSVLIFIIILLVLVVGHEFGHFLAAKFARMKVEEFGVGFPPKLWGKKIGETEYSVNAIPFGGFVKIFGEDPKENEVDEHAFSNRSQVAQAGVLLAGPFANLLLAFLFSTAAFAIGTSVVVDETNEARVTNPRVLVTAVLVGSPAEKAGFMVGDEIVSLTKDMVTTFIHTPEEFVEAVSTVEDSLIVSFLHRGEQVSLSMTPVTGVISEDRERKAVGIATSLVGIERLPIHKAMVSGFRETIEKLSFVVEGLFTLLVSAFTLSADFSLIAGPVGIASITGDVVSFGVGSLLSFAALISLNLFVINLLPFPALDGGRLAFLGIEAVFRRKIPSRFSNVLNTIGFVLLIVLMVAVTAQDIFRLVS